ncbi:unannotated protein [freshwater metagenome]|uniref:Unannotated protein n=1 Tax=freshwater metagenome TaxID=449393 RepID=A0A6J7IHS9_9ZZZZ|nr:integral membrane sensor signal transduction histidine kinase [Actinomycetota bacterium]
MTTGSHDADTPAPPADAEASIAEPAPASEWIVLSDARPRPDRASRPLKMGRIYAQLIASALVVLVVIAVGGGYASRSVAEREAINDATHTTDLLAQSAIAPVIVDALLTGSPAALATLDEAVRARVLGSGVIRVKVWTPDGLIVYSDEPRIIGSTFPLGEEERDVLVTHTTHAEVSDLSKPENRYERADTTLLEVYRPVWTPAGKPLLFETYLSYDSVTARTGALWSGFAGITVTSLLLLLVLILPILWRLLDRVKAVQDQRVALLEHAVDASADERRRIAGTLHDGVVQELAAASFAVSGAAERAERDGEHDLSVLLRSVASAVRGTIGSLRTLLVDIYPPSLRSAGLVAALDDLAGTVRTRDIEVGLQMPADGHTGLDEEGERLVYRVAQETMRNVARHAAATRVEIALVVGVHDVVMTIADDGQGFDVIGTLAHPPEGHFGLQVLSELAAQSGAALHVMSAPGSGTTWRLTVPRP